MRISIVVGALVVVAAAGAACGAPTRPLAAEDPAPSTTTESVEPTLAPAVEGFGTKPKPTTTPTRRPPPSRKPPTETKLPPPPPKTTCTGQRYVGTAATRAQVKQALEAAAAKTYWPTSAPQIKIPVTLVKAVAWQESGWQSNVVACDGGVGLMQVMPDTATFVNNRFEQRYDINKYPDNAILGANYLAWLVKYFGDVYFQGSYDLATTDPANPVLLDAVIAAYNVGFGAVDTKNGLVIPNRQYVNNVEALMQKVASGLEPP